MNISLGAAVFPSTKRGRSPRMPGDSAAANRGVAPSRVGKRLLQGRRGQGARLVPFAASAAYLPRSGRGAANIKHPEIGETYMTGTIRTLRVDKGFGFI